MDWPIPQATPNVIRESLVAIERWEPRVDLLSVDVQQYNPDTASITVTAEWQVEGFTGQTQVNFAS